jgi:hypothetical protein
VQQVRLSSDKRPGAVHIWLKGKRKFGVIPEIGQVQTFAHSWWAWWESLQPGWRITNGRPFSQQIPLGGETWQSVYKGGPNGFFIVVLTISWWLLSINKVFNDEFSQAFNDLLWVSDRMISIRSGKRLNDDSSGSNTRSNKKQVCLGLVTNTFTDNLVQKTK